MKHNKKKAILAIVVFILFSSSTMAQKDKNSILSKKLRFGYGLAYNIKLDRTYSRLPKNGANHLFNIEYENVNEKRIVSGHLNFMLGTLKSKGNNVNNINDYSGYLKTRYLRRINITDVPKLSFYLGANATFRSDFWFPKESQLRYGWDANLGLGLATSIRYLINHKLIIQYDTDISLIGILWRSSNNGQQLETEEVQLERGLVATAFSVPRFSHVQNTLYVDNSIKLSYTLFNKIEAYYGMELSYRYIQNPLLKKGYEWNNLIGLAYKF